MKTRAISKDDEARLIAAGWRKLAVSHAWNWQEPKTRACYRAADALDLVNVKGGKNVKES